ncbi:VOC family protein [Halobellus rufus]|uniref:VOC family protein n=1 Tax=Halobellus rufus TaxID=1448860 RepID=UPI0012E08092|nr:VOC family protein [Halobellus rufus]
MTGVRKLEYVHLQVTDLDDALAFYTTVMGLNEYDYDGDHVALGCGLDDRVDLLVTEGGTGVAEFAVRVPDEATLADLETQLNDADVDVKDPHGPYDGVAFVLPSEIRMALVVPDSGRREYHHPSEPNTPDRSALTPLDLDHINLASTDPRADAEFLRNVLGFNVSDIRKTDRGYWTQVFTRFGDYHHDVAITITTDISDTLHHLAWTMTDIAHLKTFADLVVQHGHNLELGIGRHNAGGNLFMYLWTPGGNRFEFNAEVATLDATSPVRYQGTEGNSVSIWDGVYPPKSFKTRCS